MRPLLHRFWLVAIALWVASAIVESNHHHAKNVACLQCLCPSPGRRRSELTVPGSEQGILRNLDSKIARVLDRAALPQADFQVECSLGTRIEVPQGFAVVVRQVFVSPDVRLRSFVLSTGPPRAPPVSSS